jgi:hypothetical protein
MKNLTRVRIRKYLTMVGVDAIEAQILSEYFHLSESYDTGNDTLDSVLNALKLGGYLTVGMMTTYSTNLAIRKYFKDAEELAMFRDKDLEGIKNRQNE